MAVVVPLLVEHSVTTPEVRGSKPVIGKLFLEHMFTVNCIEKANIEKNRPGMAHLKKIGHRLFDLHRREKSPERTRTFAWPK